jgi:hypothetical protein
MGQTGIVTPLSDRRRDIFFIVAFSFFAFSSFFSDAWHALGLLEGDAFWSRANRWYAEIAADEYFAAEHDYLRVGTGISAFIYGPFYLVLVYAFAKGKNWIRPMALVYVGSMLHGMTEYIAWEYWLGPAPGETLIFWAFNGPYAIVPILLGVRMWKPNPFGGE